MTHDLEATSSRYILTQFAFFPHEDGTFTLFHAYGTARTAFARLTEEELIAHLRADFSKRKALHAEQLRKEDIARAEKRAALDAIPDIKIDLNELDLDIQI